MKRLSLLILLISFVACDPYGFGFKKNPAYVLDEAFKAMTNLDEASYIEVAGKEALCMYGTAKGLSYLKERLQVSADEVKLKPTVLNSKYHAVPEFVDFWSYYSERYQIEILDKRSNKLIIKAIVDCEYGTEGERNQKLLRLKPKQYKTKECRLTKLIPVGFENLPLSTKCSGLKVNL